MTELYDRPLAFVDLETTGATANIDRITEIAIITYNGRETSAWSHLVNPETRIPAFIEGLTGIRNEMVADAPVFKELAFEIQQRLKGHIFIAHNARFDYGFLKNEFKRLGQDFRTSVLCTVKLSRKLYPQYKRHSLDSLIERHELSVKERHRALGDAEVLVQFWKLLEQSFDQSVLQATIKELSARPSLPPHIDSERIDEIPEGHGVYLFYGENDLPLYIGKSNHLKQRVLSHFSSDHLASREMSLSQQLRRIDWIECAGEIQALITEARLIKALQPTLNIQLRPSKAFCSWFWNDEQERAPLLRLVYARDLHFGRQDHLYGLFKNQKEAKNTLSTLAKEMKLCPVVLGLEKGTLGKPCFAYQIKRCKGVCCGEESWLQHAIRLKLALSRLKLKSWPYDGPAVLSEGAVKHVIDAWCYLGAATNDEEIETLLQEGTPSFDKDTFRILVKHMHHLQPLKRSAVEE